MSENTRFISKIKIQSCHRECMKIKEKMDSDLDMQRKATDHSVGN